MTRPLRLGILERSVPPLFDAWNAAALCDSPDTSRPQIARAEVTSMAKWKRQKLRMKPDHGWKTKPDYKIVVADRGALRFDVPRGWVMSIETDDGSGRATIKL